MVSLRAELPPEGDETEARELVRRHPITLPTAQPKLQMVHVATLNVDYSPHHGTGYARPLSPYRLKQLREEWDPRAVGALMISRRSDGTFWIIDGNHRRYVAYEHGMQEVPAVVHMGLSREDEADLYTKLGTILGQTPWTRFQAKIVSGDQAANDIHVLADRYGLEIAGGNSKQDSRIQAVARVEFMYARGGPDGLNWVLGCLMDAFGGDRDSLGEMTLEGTFGFYLRYADRVSRKEVAQIMGANGLYAWHNRAAGVYDRVDIGARGNTYGLAIAEMVNEVWKKKGVKLGNLLPAWERNTSAFGSRYREVKFRDRGVMSNWTSISGGPALAPQHLGAA